MPFASFRRVPGSLIVATAIHNGHELRGEVEERLALDPMTRMREEDPFTETFARAFDTWAIVHRSRFEVDLNRPRGKAIYTNAEDAWDLDVWEQSPPAGLMERSLELYDRFYADLAELLDGVVSTEGGFVLYDIHSYNHRREGPDSSPAPQAANPTVNLGTGSLPAGWRPVADRFVEVLSAQGMGPGQIDTRENVRFKGGYLAAWVHERYGEVGCALAIELKKVWMDEWTGVLDVSYRDSLRNALLVTAEPVAAAWRVCAGHRG